MNGSEKTKSLLLVVLILYAVASLGILGWIGYEALQNGHKLATNAINAADAVKKATDRSRALIRTLGSAFDTHAKASGQRNCAIAKLILEDIELHRSLNHRDENLVMHACRIKLPFGRTGDATPFPSSSPSPNPGPRSAPPPKPQPRPSPKPKPSPHPSHSPPPKPHKTCLPRVKPLPKTCI